jgi:hypothetical protein
MPRSPQQLPDRDRRTSAEEAERLFLGRYQRDLDATDAACLEHGRGHQGQLVDRQRPHGAERDDERHAPSLA